MKKGAILVCVLVTVVFSACKNTCECVTTYTTNGEEVMPSVKRTEEISNGSCSYANLTIPDKGTNITATTICK